MTVFSSIFSYISITISCILLGNLLPTLNLNSTKPSIPEKTESLTKNSENKINSFHIVSFHASIVNNQVLITWKANNATKNNFFLLEKSSNGAVFKTISKISSFESNKDNVYSVTDSEIPKQTVYYRISSVEGKNEKPEHCEVFALSNTLQTNSDCSIKISPDPCFGKCTITFCNTKKSNTISGFSTFDFLGNALFSEFLTPVETSGLKFDQENYLKPGIFFSKISIVKKS